MAIFYNHIKGCGASSTGQTSSTKDLWTWIKFADITGESVNTDLTDSNKNVEYLPSILLYSSNDTTNTTDTTDVRKDFGKIITSKAINQKIETNFTFEQDIILKNEHGLEWDIPDIPDTSKPFLTCDEEMLWMYHPTNIEIESDETEFLGKVILSNTTTIDSTAKYTVHTTGEAKINHCLYVGPDSADGFDPTEVSEGTIKAQNKCEALYFNATSDRRAKENITPVQFSALATVNSLPIYSFNYLSQPETVTIGLIAQEAAEHNLDDFNMVDNLDASGQGSDMMQMKESKLVYVLWKAVQELSAEVEELKAEIRNLK